MREQDVKISEQKVRAGWWYGYALGMAAGIFLRHFDLAFLFGIVAIVAAGLTLWHRAQANRLEYERDRWIAGVLSQAEDRDQRKVIHVVGGGRS